MFEGLKKSFQDRIEKNSKKSILDWTDSKGNVHTEEVILKRSKLPLIGDWGRVYPPVNEDGSWNYVNLIFGGWKNLFKLLLILGLVALFFLAYREPVNHLNYIQNIPCVKSCLATLNNIG